MPQKIIVYWRDIPAQIIVKQGRKTARRQLSERFEKAVDQAAMRAKLTGTDDYLAEWRRSDPESVEGEIETLADTIQSEVEDIFDRETVKALVANFGYTPKS